MARPLDGIKIVDLTYMLMAPYTTQVLGDMGADVVKVEPPEGDPVRNIGPYHALGTPQAFANDPRYASMTTRTEHIDSIYSELAETLLTPTSADWLELFDKADIPAMPLKPANWSKTQPALDKLAPRLGEHSAEVLREIGFDEVRMADMMANGVSAVAEN